MTTAMYPQTFPSFPAFRAFAIARARLDERHILRDQKLEALSNTPLFSTLTAKHLDLIARVTDRVDVKAGTTLMYQGNIATHMSVLIDGTASVVIDGTEVAVLGPGDIVGELSMVDDRPASATVTINEASTVWLIARAGFIPVWDDNPEMANAMLRSVVTKLRNTNVAAYSTARS